MAFYAAQLVSDKHSPLHLFWVASHRSESLKKRDIFSANVVDSVAKVREVLDKVPMALRLSGHLVLGIVRIHARQVAYLLEDFENVNQTFRGIKTVDLAPRVDHAAVADITLLDADVLDEIAAMDLGKAASLPLGALQASLSQQPSLRLMPSSEMLPVPEELIAPSQPQQDELFPDMGVFDLNLLDMAHLSEMQLDQLPLAAQEEELMAVPDEALMMMGEQPEGITGVPSTPTRPGQPPAAVVTPAAKDRRAVQEPRTVELQPVVAMEVEAVPGPEAPAYELPPETQAAVPMAVGGPEAAAAETGRGERPLGLTARGIRKHKVQIDAGLAGIPETTIRTSEFRSWLAPGAAHDLVVPTTAEGRRKRQLTPHPTEPPSSFLRKPLSSAFSYAGSDLMGLFNAAMEPDKRQELLPGLFRAAPSPAAAAAPEAARPEMMEMYEALQEQPQMEREAGAQEPAGPAPATPIRPDDPDQTVVLDRFGHLHEEPPVPDGLDLVEKVNEEAEPGAVTTTGLMEQLLETYPTAPRELQTLTPQAGGPSAELPGDTEEIVYDTVTREMLATRTKEMVRRLRGAFGVTTAEDGKTQVTNPEISLLSHVLPAASSRLEAARSFFEVLTLKSKGLLELTQDTPAADLHVLPTAKLLTPVAA